MKNRCRAEDALAIRVAGHSLEPRRPLLVILVLCATCAPGCKELNPLYCSGTYDGTRCITDAPIASDSDSGSGSVSDSASDSGHSTCTTNGECHVGVCDITGSHMCVPCTPIEPASCTGVTPVCSADNLCRACKVDDECTSSNVCDAASGACLAEDTVLYISPAGTGTLCTQTQPCGQLATALGLVAGDKRTIKMLPGSYTERVTMTNLAISIHGQGADLSEASAGEVMRITGASTVDVLGLRIHDGLGGSGDGILCINDADNTPMLILESVVIDSNNGLGVNATKCSVSIIRSAISGNHGGGIGVVSGAFDIANTFITRNGDSSVSPVGGASLASGIGSVNRFEFNTVADNLVRNGGFLSGGVACDIAGFAAPNNIIAHNFVNTDATQTNSNTNGLCVYPTSTVTASLTDLNFASPSNTPYDYHLLPGSSAIDAATTPSMIHVDGDGNVRPQGAANDQGADEVVQP